ncbi:hypothetical protein [Streptococcus plurextorum]|uniref:hypothetical protein n=1 Tax=Streptococcus plurextorum TaxID=456876 RepID=UPI000429E4A1|nr:hypothetical protein [Streptococcus plurextorum]
MKKRALLCSLLTSLFMISATSNVAAQERPDMQKIADNAYIIPDKTDTEQTVFNVSQVNYRSAGVAIGIATRLKTITIKIVGENVPVSRTYSEYYNSSWYYGTLHLTKFDPNSKTATYSGILVVQNW